ncbi:DMT family transporter [Undibacterium sp. Rencai35W]|uniref:DMT family transporter n=1 Tax=Undibacterium sp. Rencai35W TaxID=3413046 RepID=UPI003BF296CD
MKITSRTALLLTLPPLLWAGNAVVGRLAVGSMPPLLLNACRWSLALLVLLPLGWRALRHPRDLLVRWRYLLLLGGLGVGCYNALQYLALRTSTPLNVTLIAASLPVWMLLLGATVYREKPRRNQILGAVFSLLGVALVLSRGQLSALAQVQFVPGDLYMLLAVMAWAGYSWLLARPPRSMQGAMRPVWGWAEFLLVQTSCGLIFAGSAAGLEHMTAAPVHWTPWLILALLYVAIGPSVIAYRCWGLGVAEVGPTLAAFFGNLTPVFAAILSALMLGVWPQWFHALAFVLIAAGIVVSSRPD